MTKLSELFEADQKFSVGDTVKLRPALDKRAQAWCANGRENNTTAIIQAYLGDETGEISGVSG